MNSISPRKCRRASSLIEMLLYISLATLLLPLAFTTTVRTFRAAGAVREQAESLNSLERLSRRFSDDVHEATEAAVAHDAKQLVLTLPGDRRVTYQASATAFERAVASGNAIQERDTFPFSQMAPAGVKVRSDPAEAVLLLRLVLDGQEPENAAGRTFDLSARVGRNHRFEGRE